MVFWGPMFADAIAKGLTDDSGRTDACEQPGAQ